VAPVLLCPECGTKHPLDNVAANASFPCTGCGRTLKVPAQAREMAAAGSPDAAPAPVPAPAPMPAAPVASPAPDASSTSVLAPVPPVPAAAAAASSTPPLGPPAGIPALDLARTRREVAGPTSASPLTPPAWMRFLLWVVAVPLAFIVVFGFARAFGLLTTNNITDVALAEGWRRFWPIVRLLPFVALVTAIFVTAGVYAIARLRARPRQGSGGTGSTVPRTPRQSSRAGA
jgi:hypothetical protein